MSQHYSTMSERNSSSFTLLRSEILSSRNMSASMRGVSPSSPVEIVEHLNVRKSCRAALPLSAFWGGVFLSLRCGGDFGC